MVNPELGKIRAKRIRQLIDREGITLTALAIKIGTSQQRLSEDLKKGKISERRIEDIHNQFPHYNYEWLAGRYEYPTQRAENLAVYEKTKDASQIMQTALIQLAMLSDFTVKMNHDVLSKDAETLVKAIHGDYIEFSREGKKVSLSIFDLNRLENKICDYVNFELSHMIE